MKKRSLGSTRDLAFLAAHVLLGLASRSLPVLSTVHFLIVTVVGVFVAAQDDSPDRPLLVAAYVVGSEVYWRMTGGSVFWEGAKYLVVLILLIAGLKSKAPRGPRAALLFFVLLIPSSIITFITDDLDHARSQVSFYLSGPLSLSVSAWFCARFQLDDIDLRKISYAIIGPTCAVLAISVASSISGDVSFGDASNYVTSGGYGPNQVSAMLGLGAFLCFQHLVDGSVTDLRVRIALGGLLAVFGLQSALTFSRGGLYGAAIATVVYMIALAGQRGTRVRVLGGLVVIAVLAETVLYPWLEARTGGAITERFADTGTTGREDMALREAAAFLDQPIFGLGPGGGLAIRYEGRPIAAHTEYSRLLAEHGIFGLTALLLLIGLAVSRIRSAQPGLERARAGALIFWALAFMMHAAMRLAAPGFVFGLAMAGFARTSRGAPEPAVGPEEAGVALTS